MSMFSAKEAALSEIDAWSIDRAGFSPRIVHALGGVGIRTVGELRCMSRDHRASVHNLGAGSVQEMERFFETCDAMAGSRLSFGDLGALFDRFITPHQRTVLEWRHALRDAGSAGAPATLQRIADHLEVTRERVRQIEVLAIRALGSHLAQQSLAAVYAVFQTFIAERHGIVPAAALQCVVAPGLLGNYPPAPVLELLCRCGGDIVRHHDLYSTLPLESLAETEQRLLRILKQGGSPMAAHDAVAALAGLPLLGDAREADSRVGILLENMAGVSATMDARYFTGAEAAAALVAEVVQRHRHPVHFRLILREANTLLRPGSRLGAGRLLSMLHDGTRFTRVASGHYALKAHGRASPTVALAPEALYR